MSRWGRGRGERGGCGGTWPARALGRRLRRNFSAAAPPRAPHRRMQMKRAASTNRRRRRNGLASHAREGRGGGGAREGGRGEQAVPVRGAEAVRDGGRGSALGPGMARAAPGPGAPHGSLGGTAGTPRPSSGRKPRAERGSQRVTPGARDEGAPARPRVWLRFGLGSSNADHLILSFNFKTRFANLPTRRSTYKHPKPAAIYGTPIQGNTIKQERMCVLDNAATKCKNPPAQRMTFLSVRSHGF